MSRDFGLVTATKVTESVAYGYLIDFVNERGSGFACTLLAWREFAFVEAGVA